MASFGRRRREAHRRWRVVGHA